MTERETEVGSTFRFISFHFLFARCFQTNVAKDKQEFSPCSILCRVLLRDAGKMQCAVRSAEQSERLLILSRL